MEQVVVPSCLAQGSQIHSMWWVLLWLTSQGVASHLTGYWDDFQHWKALSKCGLILLVFCEMQRCELIWKVDSISGQYKLVSVNYKLYREHGTPVILLPNTEETHKTQKRIQLLPPLSCLQPPHFTSIYTTLVYFKTQEIIPDLERVFTCTRDQTHNWMDGKPLSKRVRKSENGR